MRLLLLLVFLVSLSRAEVPYVTKDSAVDENFLYVTQRLKRLETVPLQGYALLTSSQSFSGGNEFVGVSTFTGNVAISSVSVSGSAGFTSAASTVTFSGWVDVGLELVSNACGAVASCTATCTAGKRVLGGGCLLTGSAPLNSGYPSTNSTFYCERSAGAPNVTTYAICARIK